jgi:hypothetical protein
MTPQPTVVGKDAEVLQRLNRLLQNKPFNAMPLDNLPQAYLDLLNENNMLKASKNQ